MNIWKVIAVLIILSVMAGVTMIDFEDFLAYMEIIRETTDE